MKLKDLQLKKKKKGEEKPELPRNFVAKNNRNRSGAGAHKSNRDVVKNPRKYQKHKGKSLDESKKPE